MSPGIPPEPAIPHQPSPSAADPAAPRHGTDTTGGGTELVEELPTAECWRLLEYAQLGRLAVDGADGIPDVFPVNFLVHSGAVYIRTAPGGKIASVTARPVAAFEVDGEAPAFRWSVVIRGAAHRVDDDADIRASGILELMSWSPTSKHQVIRLTPATVTGRRFRRRLPDVPRHATVPVSHDIGKVAAPGNGHEGGKPTPIPHFPPPVPD